MKYYIRDNEVAIVLKPHAFDEDGEWTGELSTGLVVGDNSDMDSDTLSYIIHLATLMATFLEVAQDDEDLYNIVEERRNALMGLDNPIQNLYEEVEGTDGNVVKLTKYTKTLGEA